MDRSLRSCAVAGVAVVGTGLIGLTPATIEDIQRAAPHGSVEVALTSAADSLGVDIGGLLSGDLDLPTVIVSFAPYFDRLTVEIVDTFDRLNDSSAGVDSALASIGITGTGDWIGAEYGLVQSALVAEGFDPSTVDSDALFGSDLSFDLDLGWASWLLGLSGDHSAELNELLDLSSQLLTGSLNLLVVSLGTINPVLGDLGPDTDLTEVLAVVQPLYEESGTQGESVLAEMHSIIQDLGLFNTLGSAFDL